MRVLEWFLVAGAFAVGRRSIPKATFLVTWFGAYLVFKGGANAAIVQQGSFFRLVQPALPVVVILAAACVLLVPSVARRAGASTASLIGPHPAPTADRGSQSARCCSSEVLPLSSSRPCARCTSAFSPQYSRDIVVVPVNALPARGDPRRAAGAAAAGSTRTTTARGPSTVSSARSRQKARTRCPTSSDGLRCTTGDLPTLCTIFSDVIATTRASIYVDRPPPGRWTYRIALSANAYDSLDEGDVVLVSNGAVVRIP